MDSDLEWKKGAAERPYREEELKEEKNYLPKYKFPKWSNLRV